MFGPEKDLDWELGNDTCPKAKGFDLVHRRPQIGVEVGVSNLYPVSSYPYHSIIKDLPVQ
jgi:hypothetical protein